MKRNALNRIGQLIVAALTMTTVAAAQDATPAEIQQAKRYLAETQKGLVDAVRGFTDAQWKFKPAPDRWSAAEIVEHVALIEDVVHGVLEKIPQAPPPAAGRDVQHIDQMLLAKVNDRSTKFQAPEAAKPTSRWTPADALDHFRAGRARTTELLTTTPGLRAHAIAHPVFGSMDGYQWVLAVAAHAARHTQQILEVKADANFPAARRVTTPGVH
jgi:hypothetical protein